MGFIVLSGKHGKIGDGFCGTRMGKTIESMSNDWITGTIGETCYHHIGISYIQYCVNMCQISKGMHIEHLDKTC